MTTPQEPAMGVSDEWPEYLMLRDTKLHDDMGGLGQRIFTTAGAGYEKRKYVRADLAALPHMQPAGEAVANGKLVGWWNGISPDATGRSLQEPSVRWGADGENSRHDIPLYDGYNPIHYRDPSPTPPQPSADARDGELAALRSFAQDVMEAWPMYDVDGGALQDAAERHGLLLASERTVPCGEDCACSEFCTEGETTRCYQRTELLTGAAIAAQREAGEG